MIATQMISGLISVCFQCQAVKDQKAIKVTPVPVVLLVYKVHKVCKGYKDQQEHKGQLAKPVHKVCKGLKVILVKKANPVKALKL